MSLHLNRQGQGFHGALASVTGHAIITSNHARLASVDFGLQAHFGGFFFFGVRA